jgi:DNA invertase Pin-like site-specific DNA recombinase
MADTRKMYADNTIVLERTNLQANRTGLMAVYGYIRVATLPQTDENDCIGTQQRSVEAYARMVNLSIDHHFVETGVTGSTPLGVRPAGSRLLALVREADVIITSRLDCIFGSSLDTLGVLALLRARRVLLHVVDIEVDVTSESVSKLLISILSAVVETEHDQARQLINDAKTVHKQRTRYMGGKMPFGFTVGSNGELIAIDAQQQAIREMVQLKAEGLSLRAISEEMKARGHVVSHVTVKELLERASHNDGSSGQ